MRKIPTMFFAFFFALCSMFSLVPRENSRTTEKTYEPGLEKHFEAAWRYLGDAVSKYHG